jgi:L-amino acid N-acyltransferase YncA
MVTQTEAASRAIDADEVSRCRVRPATPVDIRHMTAIYGNFVATSTATFEIVSPDEAKMVKRWRAGACPHLAIKPPDMGRPNTRISDVDRPALMVLMLLPAQAKTGLEWATRQLYRNFKVKRLPAPLASRHGNAYARSNPP